MTVSKQRPIQPSATYDFICFMIYHFIYYYYFIYYYL